MKEKVQQLFISPIKQENKATKVTLKKDQITFKPTPIVNNINLVPIKQIEGASTNWKGAARIGQAVSYG